MKRSRNLAMAGLFWSATALAPTAASAALITFQVTFEELNNNALIAAGGMAGFSSGSATLVYNDMTSILQLSVNATGLTGGAPHPIHIHGLVVDGSGNLTTNAAGGMNVDSVSPTIAADQSGFGDNDGFIETMEGVPAYGDVLLSLFSPPGSGNFVADASGVLNFTETYDLNDSSIFTPSPATGTVYAKADLLPLDLREIVIHGTIVPNGAGAGSFELQGGPGGFVPLLPVASGAIEFVSIQQVPEPITLALFGFGLAGLAVAARRRKTY